MPTKKINKIENLKTRKEVFEYGFDQGYGRGLGGCIGYFRKLLRANTNKIILTPELLEDMKIKVVNKRKDKLERQLR